MGTRKRVLQMCEWSKDDGLSAELLISIGAGCVHVIENEKRPRNPNQHYDRQRAIDFVGTWSQILFKRQFGVERRVFDELAESLQAEIRPRKIAMAVLSSGSTVGLITKLLITLRILRGAMVLDMIWYGVPHSHVDTYVTEMLRALHKCSLLRDIIHVAQTEEEVNAVRAGWEWRQKQANGVDLLPGLMYAVDGLVVEIGAPCHRDVLGFGALNVDDFFNRKGYHAIVCQGACDAFTEFGFFTYRHTGNTNDHIAWESTTLHKLFGGRLVRGDDDIPDDIRLLYENLLLALDEAYGPLGGRHLTPYTEAQLRRLRDEYGQEVYEAALLFNNRLSSSRITIERAFGILVRRWGILRRPLAYGLKKNMLVIDVCVRLHNLCVRTWKQHRGVTAATLFADEPYCARLDRSIWLDLAEVREVRPEGGDFIANENPAAAKAVQNAIRDGLRDRMQTLGFRYNTQTKEMVMPHNK